MSEFFQLADMTCNLTGASIARVKRAMTRAWRTVLSLRCGEGLAMVAHIEPYIFDLPPRAADDIRKEIAMLRAVALALRDECVAALPIVSAAIEPDETCPAASIAATICRLGYWKLRDLSRFQAVKHLILDANASRSQVRSKIFDLSIEAAFELEQLRLVDAWRLASEALALSADRLSPDIALAAFPACVMAQILYEQGSIDEAEHILSRRLASIRMGGTIESAVRAYPLLARIAAAHNETGLALALLADARALGERRGWPRLIAASLADETDLLVLVGKIRAAEDCVRQLELLVQKYQRASTFACVELSRYCSLARSRVAFLSTPSRGDAAALRQLHHEAAYRHDRYIAVQVTIRLVEALLILDEESAAIAIFVRALRLGEATGLFQTFIDAGPRVHELLGQIDVLGTAHGHDIAEIRPLIRALQLTCATVDEKKSRRWCTPSIARPRTHLSRRERGILELIGLGLSNKEIASRLGIAPETVKTHAKRVFAKLSVKNRAEAVICATRLGLVHIPTFGVWNE
jgi:ATP/maltotriose-dependent transcriptional regulator MalT